MSDNPNAVTRVIEAAGGKGKIARATNLTFQAWFQWEKAGWLPLARAQQVIEMYPGAATLRELVRADIGAAMDISSQQALLD